MGCSWEEGRLLLFLLSDSASFVPVLVSTVHLKKDGLHSTVHCIGGEFFVTLLWITQVPVNEGFSVKRDIVEN